jgi:xanthine dehydrogenase accessory factor
VFRVGFLILLYLRQPGARVKHWQELVQILDRVVRLGREGRVTALALVTRINGSAYRRPGAKLLIEGEGLGAGSAGFVGGISGGCLEEDVRDIGLGVRASGRTRVLHYDTGGDDSKLWGLGLGCDGEIDVLVVPVPPEAALGPWARVLELLSGDAAFALALPVEEQVALGGPVVVDRSGRLAGRLDEAGLDADAAAAATAALVSGRSGVEVRGGRRIFTEVLLPPPKLLVCGAGDDARAMVAFGAGVGFRTFVADHRPAYLTAARFPEAQGLVLARPEEESVAIPADHDTYAVIKTHALARDTAWARRLLATDIPYVGVLGPRGRIEKIERALDQHAPLRPEARARLFGPVGLDLGADGPEQVGLSVIAELLAVRAGRAPRHLRERKEAIHA